MIAHLNGVLFGKYAPHVVIDCHGVGYEVEVPMSTYCDLPEQGESIQLLIHQVIREDAHVLYGFGSEQERNVFRQLLKVNGIGAKSSLGILSAIGVDEISRAIEEQDVDVLVSVPGVGRKTADRLLLELNGKFKATGSKTAKPVKKAINEDILSALVSLGYKDKEAAKVIEQLDPNVTVNEGIRLALKALSAKV